MSSNPNTFDDIPDFGATPPAPPRPPMLRIIKITNNPGKVHLHWDYGDGDGRMPSVVVLSPEDAERFAGQILREAARVREGA